MSKGAAQCRVSQSAASQHVQEVERRLGLTLFDRSKRPLELTAAGQLYAEYCRDVLRREEELGLALEGLKRGCERNVAGGVDLLGGAFRDEAAAGGVQCALSRRASRGGIHASGKGLRGGAQRRWPSSGLVSYPEATREIAAIPWRRRGDASGGGALASAGVAGDGAAGRLGRPGVHRVRRRPFDPARDWTGFFRAQGVEVRLVMHFDNIQTIKEAVALGSGMSILPARTMQAEIAQGRLVAIPLEAPELVRPVGVVHRRRRKLGRAAEAFLELLR